LASIAPLITGVSMVTTAGARPTGKILRLALMLGIGLKN
jgi:hypothetical protein